MPVVGEAGQARLAAAHVVVVGVGALGCQSADLLARAGIGSLTLVDRDVVELSNLQRQTLFDERDAAGGLSKACAAQSRLNAVNSAIQIRAITADVRARNALQILTQALGGQDVFDAAGAVIIDGTDNFHTRYLLNDCAVKLGVPYVYGGVIGVRGMCAIFAPGAGGPCLRCIFPDPPPPGTTPTCDTAGVLGPAVAVVGAHQASMAMRCIVDGPVASEHGLIDFDIWSGQQRRLSVHKVPGCVCCHGGRLEFLDEAHDDEATQYCGSDAVQVWPARSSESLRLVDLAGRLARVGRVVQNAAFLRVRIDEPRASAGGIELTVFADGRAIVRGAGSLEAARSIYAKYVGN